MHTTTFDFSTFVTQELNDAQRAAVFHKQGPLLVVAGAGSGKTRVITARITHLLLNEQVLPHNIVALTFTNKAAQEMKERIRSFLGSSHGTPFVGTFHSYCLYLLKKNSHALALPAFSIIDEDDKRALIQQLLKKSTLYKKYTAQQLSYYISLHKNNAPTLSTSIRNHEKTEVHQIIDAYEKEKRQSKCYDFDDLLCETVKLFATNEAFKINHQHEVRHLLVDEYQDTNSVQHQLLKHMALQETTLVTDSVCAVGDEDQSIYSWRGATIDNIRAFQKDFGNTTVIKIEQNYRSKQPILAVANQIINNNTQRIEKSLWSSHEGRDCVRSVRCLSGYQEADIVALYLSLLQQLRASSSRAILYRTHAQSRTLEEALLKRSIPYTIIGGIRFYERKEIKDIIAYLRLIVNPHDMLAVRRIINCPTRGLGDVFQESFFATWQQQPLFDFHACVQHITTTLNNTKAKVLLPISALLQKHTGHGAAIDIINDLLATVEYISYLKEQYEKQEAEERIANIRELLNACHFFAQQGKHSLQAVLDEIALLQEHTADENDDKKVCLMTIHAAKGLEFDAVIITGLEETIFPSARSLGNEEQLEEERRLLYVAITRARNSLLLTHARYRQTYGTMETMISSRFLDEVSTTHCKSEDASSWYQTDVLSYFQAWLGMKSIENHVMTFKRPEVPATIAAKAPAQPKSSSAATLKKHQTVKHTSFGIGVIQTVEEKENKVFVTVAFKNGIKKLDASFVQSA